MDSLSMDHLLLTNLLNLYANKAKIMMKTKNRIKYKLLIPRGVAKTKTFSGCIKQRIIIRKPSKQGSLYLYK